MKCLMSIFESPQFELLPHFYVVMTKRLSGHRHDVGGVDWWGGLEAL